jgi:carboxypeptidase Taq
VIAPEQRYTELRSRLARVTDLGRAARLLGWDQQVMMPPAGAKARAEQLATISQIAHEEFIADEIGELLDELRPYEESLPADSLEASLLRVTRREWAKASRVPPELSAEMARAGSLGHEVWVEARAKSDFALFLPALERNLELKHRYVECFDGYEEPYDVLLDDYEPGMKTAEVRAVFDRLKEIQIPMIEAVAECGRPVDTSFLKGPFPVERQPAHVLSVLRELGFEERSWRLDPTAHPFAGGAGIDDIRLTTRYVENALMGLFAGMHEFGHGLYEHGSAAELDRTPLCGGVSLGIHESQSRLWENQVGRGMPFWRRFYPELQRTFPEALSGVELKSFWRAVNAVEPSLIRVEADEVTYNLHVIMRFELEQDMLSGSVALRDLPGEWNARMKQYLGLDVPDDANGVLQDVHWSGGIIGYFPTYSLGSVMSEQIWERLRQDLTDLDDQIEAGEFGPLRDWLREHVHQLGSRLMPQETLERATGSRIDAEPYLRYLQAKVAHVYGIDV